MDISTILGIVIALVAIVLSIGFDSLGNFIDIPSFGIVMGGTLAAVIASFPLSSLKNCLKHPKKLMSGSQYDVKPVINQIVEFAQVARRNGLLALEDLANELEDPFFKQGVMLVVDAMEADKVREMLETSLFSMDKRHEDDIAIYEKASSYAPAFGMIGTLIGLVNMLNSMDLSAGASTSIGTSMAVALITTLYGVLLANVFLSPIAKKLRIRNDEEILYKQVIIEGVLGIQAGENPKSLKEKLVSLMPQNQQEAMLAEELGSGE